MAMSTNRSRPWLSRLHFLVRLAGLTGAVAVLGAGVVAYEQGLFGTADRAPAEALRSAGERALAVVQGTAEEDSLFRVTAYVFLGGAACALLWLLAEALGVLRFTAARRSAFGLNALLQVGLAAALLVGVNVYSFHHYARVDCTRDSEFTLPVGVQEQLRRLRGETTIVVLQQRRKAAADDRFEDYQSAAEAVVVEKVRDLADQLREFGPQFRVVLLDAKRKDYRTRLDEATKDRPKLADAIKNAPPGNSIFLHATVGEGGHERPHVQRLSFDDFYQLDLTRSRPDSDRGNLVLLNKGVGPLVSRLLNLEEKKPKVGILVVHEVFTTEGPSEALALRGLKKALAEHGFEVRNVVLKRNLRGERFGGWRSDPAADTVEETRYERLRNRLDELPIVIGRLEGQVKREEDRKKMWAEAKPADLRRLAGQLGVAEIPEEDRKRQVAFFGQRADAFRDAIADQRKQLKEVEDEIAKLNADVIGEQRRMSDLAGKLDRVLADCDLLLVPRLTLLPDGDHFPDEGGLHRMEDFQVSAVREFLKDGKPLLACLGPMVDPRSRVAPDGLEDLLAELHIKADRETVVFDVQSDEFAEKRVNPFLLSSRAVPPIDFTTPHGELRPPSAKGPPAARDNPLRESLRRAGEAWGGGLNLRLRYARPVTYDADRERRLLPVGRALAATPLNPLAGLAPEPPKAEGRKPRERAAEFLWTSPACWKDAEPLPSDERPVPRYEPPGDKDADRSGVDPRRGPFPVGVAVEAPLPDRWFADPRERGKTARVAVVGHGSTFTDADLPAAREKLLLDTCNWLLGRDDLLTTADQTWSYPRLAMAQQDRSLWLWGTRLGLPVLFAWLGLVVLMARRVR